MATPVLLHSCCAPCSLAILEWLLVNDYEPTVFYYNPNIYPHEEYLLRKNEAVRYCKNLGVRFVDADPDHQMWLERVKGLENEPERGARCRVCFGVRMQATALMAKELGIRYFTTTLAGSRWKRLEQIREAALEAAAKVGPEVEYWDRDWKKGGLQERRSQLLKEGDFYNQLWCGCEFSMGHLLERDKSTLPEHVWALLPALKVREEERAKARANAEGAAHAATKDATPKEAAKTGSPSSSS